MAGWLRSAARHEPLPLRHLSCVGDGGSRALRRRKNQGLNFKIPYVFEGRPANYVPDYLVRIRDGAGATEDDLLTLILEVSGEAKKEKAEKVRTARDLWVPAVNNWGGLGRWAFLEVSDPWDAENLIRASVLELGASR